MSQFFSIHPDNPQPRLIRNTVEILNNGGLIVYPTDSCYALGCLIGNKDAMERIRRLRKVDAKHHFTLVCRDLSEISTYAKIDNTAYRLLKARTPGAYTFLLKATHEVPRRLQTPKRNTIGIRVPNHTVTQALLAQLDQPLMSSTLILADSQLALTDPLEMRERLEHEVELIIDGGSCGTEPTTVIDLIDGTPTVTRQGRGEVNGDAGY